MSSDIDFKNTTETKRYASLPVGGLSDAEYKTIKINNKFKDVTPIAGFPVEDRITHFGFIYDGFRRFVGWSPKDDAWLEIVKMPENFEADKTVEFEVVSIFDDETNDIIIHFGEYMRDDAFSVEGLYEFISDYINHVYSEEDVPIIFHPEYME